MGTHSLYISNKAALLSRPGHKFHQEEVSRNLAWCDQRCACTSDFIMTVKNASTKLLLAKLSALCTVQVLRCCFDFIKYFRGVISSVGCFWKILGNTKYFDDWSTAEFFQEPSALNAEGKAEYACLQCFHNWCWNSKYCYPISAQNQVY